MTFHRLLICILLILAMPVALAAKHGRPINPDSMGLSRGSVFSVPKQKVFNDRGQLPGQNPLLPRAYPGAPPQIPHAIGAFLPITSLSNMCLACHSRPEAWGTPRTSGTPTPIPRSHYIDLRNTPDKVADNPVGARYNCNQCHVPQTNATPLVKNTFGARRTR